MPYNRLNRIYASMKQRCCYPKCPKSGLFKGSYEECEKWIEQKKKEEAEQFLNSEVEK